MGTGPDVQEALVVVEVGGVDTGALVAILDSRPLPPTGPEVSWGGV